MRDIIENILSGLALAVLVAGILCWTTIFEALSR
jgi:hypothetical protein